MHGIVVVLNLQEEWSVTQNHNIFAVQIGHEKSAAQRVAIQDPLPLTKFVRSSYVYLMAVEVYRVELNNLISFKGHLSFNEF